MTLTREFFARSVHEVAPELIGASLHVGGVGGTIVEVEAYDHEDPASHGYGGRTDRNAVMDALRREGVATAEYVPCIHLQPYMRERFGFAEGLCPVAEETARRTMALPFFTQIDPDDQERVVEVLRTAVAA